MPQHLGVWGMRACSVCPVPSCRSRFFGISVFRCSGILFGQDPPEPFHLVPEFADLAFLLGDDGADCFRVVRWQVPVGEQFHGVPVVFPDDPLELFTATVRLVWPSSSIVSRMVPPSRASMVACLT